MMVNECFNADTAPLFVLSLRLFCKHIYPVSILPLFPLMLAERTHFHEVDRMLKPGLVCMPGPMYH